MSSDIALPCNNLFTISDANSFIFAYFLSSSACSFLIFAIVEFLLSLPSLLPILKLVFAKGPLNKKFVFVSLLFEM